MDRIDEFHKIVHIFSEDVNHHNLLNNVNNIHIESSNFTKQVLKSSAHIIDNEAILEKMESLLVFLYIHYIYNVNFLFRWYL